MMTLRIPARRRPAAGALPRPTGTCEGGAGQAVAGGRPRRLRVTISALAAAAAAAAGLAACDQLSEETQDAGAAVVCSQIEVDSGEISDNPETARLVALIVRDLAPEENIRDIADKVADDPNALNPRAQLAEWVNDKCGR